MAKVARKGDSTTGICSVCSCTRAGEIVTGSSNVNANGKQVAKIGDTVRATCGHTGTIDSGGSPNVNSDKIARVGDTFSGTYTGTITGGSPNVNAG